MAEQNHCLDRACPWQEFGAHYEHPVDVGGDSIEMDVGLFNTVLEQLKTQRGRRCAQCSRQLIPTDGDHSFCDDCWDEIMVHEFFPEEENEEICDRCGERADYKDHKSSTARKKEDEI